MMGWIHLTGYGQWRSVAWNRVNIGLGNGLVPQSAAHDPQPDPGEKQ